LRTVNKFILSLVASLVAADVLLAWFGQQDLSVYYILNAVVFLIAALAHVNLRPRSRGALGLTASIIFIGFLISAVFKIAGS